MKSERRNKGTHMKIENHKIKQHRRSGQWEWHWANAPNALLPTHYEWWEQTIRTLALVHFYLFIVESLTQRFSGHQIRWLMVFFSFFFFCVYHSFGFHLSPVRLLVYISGECWNDRRRSDSDILLSSFGFRCVSVIVLAVRLFLSNCMMIFTAFYEHLAISSISSSKKSR